MALTRINNQALTNVTSAGLPAGSVLQCVTTNYPDDFIFTLSNGSSSDNGKMEVATGLNCSITINKQ